eukprot:477174-Ditylum_brightwellii.AAC.1
MDQPEKDQNLKTLVNTYHTKLSFVLNERDTLCPRSKFATLLAVIIQQFPSMVLEKWNKQEMGQVITTGEDL